MKNLFAQLLLQLVRIHSAVERGLRGDAPRLVKPEDGFIHGDHALCRGGLDDRIDLMDAAVPDHGAHGIVQMHDLKGRDQPAVHSGQQLLADDRLQHLGQLDADLLLLGGGGRRQ